MRVVIEQSEDGYVVTREDDAGDMPTPMDGQTANDRPQTFAALDEALDSVRVLFGAAAAPDSESEAAPDDVGSAAFQSGFDRARGVPL